MNTNIGIEQIEAFLLIFVRISTIMSLMPIFGSQSIPAQAKVAFWLILSMAIFKLFPAQDIALLQTNNVFEFVLFVLKEVIFGLTIGFVSTLLFTAIQFAGWLVDSEMGFGFVELMDPFTDEPVTVFGQFQVILFTILFLVFNGHYFLILAIKQSFEIVPLSGIEFDNVAIIGKIVSIFSGIFVCAIKFAAPIFVTLFIAEVALGVIARTVPQINIFFVGMPLKIVTGLLTAMLVLPMLSVLFKKTFEALIIDINTLIRLLA
jgi:flagellar biosynthetic protein FliR